MLTTEMKMISASCITRDSWETKKIRLMEKFPYLIESDLEFEDGKIHEMLDNLHIKIGNIIGVSKEGLHKFIDKI